MARPRKSQITATPRVEAVKSSFAALARENPALARRLASGNPFASGSKEIPLLEPKRWHTYIANIDADPRAFHKMKANGWLPLEEADLACPVEESGFEKKPDGSLRSPDGKDMVFKMDIQHYRMLERIKTENNMRGIGSRAKTQSEMAEAAGSQLGDEAGSYINSLDGQVIDRITGGDAA
jgi:hypothetical protein